MTTPELRFDEDGFLDLSVFPDVEPDVFGHGPGPLDPALDIDRRTLDASFDEAWVDAVLERAVAVPASTDDLLLLALVPPAPAAEEAPRGDDARPADAEADADVDEIGLDPVPGHPDLRCGGPGGAR